MSKILIAYYSRKGQNYVNGAIKNLSKGNTEVVAEMIQSFVGGELFEIYVRHFGKKIVTADGQLDKKLIGEIIFNNPDERAWINSVSHPILLNRTRDFLVDCLESGTRLVVLEVPLLFEAGWEILCDEVWAVRVRRKVQIARLMARDKLTEAQALARINSQMSTDEICSRADFVITNAGKVHRQIKAAMHGRIFR